jgi:nitrilase
MSENKLSVALVQMQSNDCIEDNFQQACTFLDKAILEHKPRLVVFPENFLCLGVIDYSHPAQELSPFIDRLAKIAKQNCIYILLGSIPILAKHNKCYSRSMLLDPNGVLLGSYDKIHLFDVSVSDRKSTTNYKESESFVAGKKHSVLPLDSFKLGLSICYDLRFPELYQSLRKGGADIIAVPSAFTYKTGQDHWEVLLRARAIETQCYVIAANQCGQHRNSETGALRKTWGHSMIIDPWGKILCSLQHAPGVCAASLDLDFLNDIRVSMNIFEHKRL